MNNEKIDVRKKVLKENGDIVIARIEDEVTVKYYERKSPEHIKLKPANKDFNDIEVDLRNTEIFIEGKSIGLIREN